MDWSVLRDSLMALPILSSAIRWWIARRYRGPLVFPDRQSLERVYPLASLLRDSTQIFGLLISGQGLLREIDDKLVASRVKQIVLPNPSVSALSNIQQSLSHMSAMFNLPNDVRNATDSAKKLKIEVLWYPEFLGITALIGDPSEKRGWAHVEICLPHMHPNFRPIVRLEKKRDSETFDRLWDTYQAIAKKSVVPSTP